jgi:Rod binding domain-containing protein
MSGFLDPAVRATASENKDTKEAAKSLEAYFLRRILSEVRGGGSIGGGGFAEDMFQEMFHETLADKMADAGGLGLAPTLEAQLDAAKAAQGDKPAELPERTGAAPAPVVNPAAAQRAYGDR